MPENKGLQKIQANRAKKDAEREEQRDARRRALASLNERLRKLGLPIMHLNGVGVLVTTPSAVAEILDHFEQKDELDAEYVSSGVVARALGITQRRLELFLAKRPELEPARISGMRAYSRDDVAAIKAQFDDDGLKS